MNNQLEQDKIALNKAVKEVKRLEQEIDMLENAIDIGRCITCNEPLHYGEADYCTDHKPRIY
jgi:hypothetical protein